MSDRFKEYYQNYYSKMGDIAYTGDKNAHTSRFLMFKEWIEKHVPKGGRILDIGCGSATFAAQNPDYEWHGLDFDIQHTKGKPITALVHNVEEYPYPYDTGSFDAITCSELQEHIFDPIAMNKEVRRLLKRDGQFFLSTPNHNWIVNLLQQHNNLVYHHEFSHTIEHIRTYNYDSHKRNLAQAGLVIEEHVGSCHHYCGVTDPLARGIWSMLKSKYNVEVPMQELHLAMGKAHPNIAHTIGLRCKKA